MSRPLRIVVGGFLGLLPAGGVAWDYVQYPAGFAGLGHDVWYVEDTGLWPVFQEDPSEGGAACARTLGAVMEDFGLAGRWAYRDAATGECFGRTEREVAELFRTADVFVNVSCASAARDDWRDVPVRILIDSDPMFTQMQARDGRHLLSGAPSGMAALLDAHTHHFTFGERIGAPECRVPVDGGPRWRPTRQPICLDRWEAGPVPEDGAWTTVMNWSAAAPVSFDGDTWGQKDVEFARFLDLPARVAGEAFAVAVAGRAFPREQAEAAGWRVLDPSRQVPDWRSYRAFLAASLGEFSVAKETYRKARTGWFSCRSACYLASGRPVVAQDTGWSRALGGVPDAGLFAFETLDEAAEAVARVRAEPQRHGRAAREVAEACFDARRVLGDLLREAGA